MTLAASTSCSHEFLANEAFEIRRLILEMAHQPHGAHLGGALSAADILSVLYHRVLRLNPDNPDCQNRDHFVLSKGHIAAGLYAALIRRGILPEGDHKTYCQNGSYLGGHPSHSLPGVEFTTGSLGHGLSLGIGLALAARKKKRGNRTFVLMGDGELQEGSVYEAASAAPRFNLSTLTAIIDRNDLQINGSVEPWLPKGALAERWKSYGWQVIEIDGHDIGTLVTTLSPSAQESGLPRLIIANTTKAKGVAFMENNRKSHSVTLSDRLYHRARGQLNATKRNSNLETADA